MYKYLSSNYYLQSQNYGNLQKRDKLIELHLLYYKIRNRFGYLSIKTNLQDKIVRLSEKNYIYFFCDC